MNTNALCCSFNGAQVAAQVKIFNGERDAPADLNPNFDLVARVKTAAQLQDNLVTTDFNDTPDRHAAIVGLHVAD